ncbi:hypothetical protein BDP27DRAFT_1311894 [Rhodocollybia butyracea]|uniref:Uncharacterized protein n=1 Tax=Rhodocollybia butyracea TaxID=206335 RepID=A0A9P5Q9H4_9AGAR|nr:hypothetical protein BDP27DRAFT_1311894 [Rhodocollybia butyracea]
MTVSFKDPKNISMANAKIYSSHNVTITALQAKLRRKIFDDINVYCVLTAMFSSLVSGFILGVMVPIVGDVMYHCRSPDDKGRALYYPVASNMFCYWLFISFVHVVMVIFIRSKVREQVSDYIGMGTTIIKSHIGYSAYLRKGSNPVVMPDVETWQPKTSFTGTFNHPKHFSTWPLPLWACVHTVMYPIVHKILQGPHRGYISAYGVYVLLLVVLTIKPVVSSFKRGYLLRKNDYLHSQRLCQEITGIMGMNSEKLTERFKEAFE